MTDAPRNYYGGPPFAAHTGILNHRGEMICRVEVRVHSTMGFATGPTNTDRGAWHWDRELRGGKGIDITPAAALQHPDTHHAFFAPADQLNFILGYPAADLEFEEGDGIASGTAPGEDDDNWFYDEDDALETGPGSRAGRAQ